MTLKEYFPFERHIAPPAPRAVAESSPPPLLAHPAAPIAPIAPLATREATEAPELGRLRPARMPSHVSAHLATTQRSVLRQPPPNPPNRPASSAPTKATTDAPPKRASVGPTDASGSDASHGNAKATSFGKMVGASAPMLELFYLLKRAAASDATALIEGETGTGKEVTAVAIHEQSARRDKPFIVVDCGAIPPQLLESELFGHERGSFTGAVSAKVGAFEAANGGTIFLDEIGELGLDLQPKILRALEGRKVKRVGSTSYYPVDVRVLAATNRSLRAEVAAKRFRSDLYYRLAVLRIQLPPLRDRKEDLPALVMDVLTRLGARDVPVARELMSPAFTEVLARYRWPGNVRQLRNYVERQVALGDSLVPPGMDSGPPGPPSQRSIPVVVPVDQPLKIARDEWNRQFEVRYLESILELHGNNVTAAARAAGVDRVHFYRLLWKHGLRGQEGDLDPTTSTRRIPNLDT